MRTKKTWLMLFIGIFLVLIIVVLVTISGFKGFHNGKMLVSKGSCNDTCQWYTVYSGDITAEECNGMGENSVYSYGWEEIYIGCGPK